MSRSLGGNLPPDLLTRLSQSDLPSHLGKTLPLITLDAEGRPHPMLVSYLEVRAADPGTIRIVISARSRSCENLRERHVATLLVVEPEQTIYVKARTGGGPHPVADLPDFALFVLTVEDVLEDSPGDWERGIRIAGGLRYSPLPSLDEPWARATLKALALAPGRP